MKDSILHAILEKGRTNQDFVFVFYNQKLKGLCKVEVTKSSTKTASR